MDHCQVRTIGTPSYSGCMCTGVPPSTELESVSEMRVGSTLSWLGNVC